MRVLAIVVSFVLATGGAVHAETLYYGSRAGMEVTVVKKSNIGSTHAKIKVKHTRENAIAFCRDYVQQVTPECINEELKVELADEISANCKTGKFSTLVFAGYVFKGPNPNYDPTDEVTYTEYLLVDVSTGEIIGGSMADGYDVALDQFKAMCPNRVQ